MMEVNIKNLLKENKKIKMESELEISALIKEKDNLERRNEKIQMENILTSEEWKMVYLFNF